MTVVKGDVLTERTAARIEGNNEARLDIGCPADPARLPSNKPAKKKAPPLKPEAAVS